MKLTPWEKDFYSPDLFDASAGDADDEAMIARYIGALPEEPTLIADIGAGTGRMTLRFIELGHRVIAIEASKNMADRLRQKVAKLPSKNSNRVEVIENSLKQVPTNATANVIIAADDFLSHFLDIHDLQEAFQQMSNLLENDGLLFTDIRGVSQDRIDEASKPLPKPMMSFGLVPVNIEKKELWVGMKALEQFDDTSRILTSHQVFDFIEPNGTVTKTMYKSIRLRRHLISEIVEAAQSQKFQVVNISGRSDPSMPANEVLGAFIGLKRKNQEDI